MHQPIRMGHRTPSGSSGRWSAGYLPVATLVLSAFVVAIRIRRDRLRGRVPGSNRDAVLPHVCIQNSKRVSNVTSIVSHPQLLPFNISASVIHAGDCCGTRKKQIRRTRSKNNKEKNHQTTQPQQQKNKTTNQPRQTTTNTPKQTAGRS